MSTDADAITLASALFAARCSSRDVSGRPSRDSMAVGSASADAADVSTSISA